MTGILVVRNHSMKVLRQEWIGVIPYDDEISQGENARVLLLLLLGWLFGMFLVILVGNEARVAKGASGVGFVVGDPLMHHKVHCFFFLCLVVVVVVVVVDIIIVIMAIVVVVVDMIQRAFVRFAVGQ